MDFTIAFRNLPFEPDSKQVIYVEGEFNEKWNTIMQAEYSNLKKDFDFCGKEFVYLPKLLIEPDVEKSVRYFAPYLTSKVREKNVEHSTLLLRYMQQPENRTSIKPSLIFNPRTEEDGTVVFSGIVLDCTSDDWKVKAIWSTLQKRTSQKCEQASESPVNADICYSIDTSESDSKKYSIVRPGRPFETEENWFKKQKGDEPESRNKSVISRVLNRILHRSSLAEEEADYEPTPTCEEQEITELIRQLQETAKSLELKGIARMAVHELIDAQDTLSRLVVTDAYDMQLPEYNVEVHLTPIQKAVYFLFLRYPEGIRLKDFSDYFDELYNIYRELQPKYKENRIRLTVSEMCNPMNNKLNETISRIRAAFIKEFDEHLAQFYYITGSAGEPYSIELDPEMVVWEE